MFNKNDDMQFDEDLFGKGLGGDLEDDSSFDMSIDESDKKPKRQKKSNIYNKHKKY